MCFSNRYHLNGIFLHPVNVFLSLKFDAFEDGFFWAAVAREAKIPHYRITDGRKSGNGAALAQREQRSERGNERAIQYEPRKIPEQSD